jgi:hypothetical protein
MTMVFDELESIIAAGKSIGSAGTARPASATTENARAPRAPRTRQPHALIEQPAPAIIDQLGLAHVEPPAPAIVAEPPPADAPQPSGATEGSGTIADIDTIAAVGVDGEKLISFRLEVEASPGPLDLRAVDDAITSHEAVRDVALLDYDGRRATLKVWIAPPANPSEVQQALADRAGTIPSDGNRVSIVALEDVA